MADGSMSCGTWVRLRDDTWVNLAYGIEVGEDTDHPGSLLVTVVTGKVIRVDPGRVADLRTILDRLAAQVTPRTGDGEDGGDEGEPRPPPTISGLETWGPWSLVKAPNRAPTG